MPVKNMTPESMNIKNRIFISLAVLSVFSILISFHGCGEETRMVHLKNGPPFSSMTAEKAPPKVLNPAAVNLKTLDLDVTDM